ncbi:helix-turn-helix domain-containing protein [Nocardioides sp. Bht2]|uniref:helix-turn-helix domain-containing protein n=1 Tax=Nocardioides sp. Bht2 TaxID=3392297 RepID=UPI0039B518F6
MIFGIDRAPGQSHGHRHDAVAAAAEVATAARALVPLAELLELTVAKVAQVTGHHMGLVLRPDQERGEFQIIAASGMSHDYVTTLTVLPMLTFSGSRGETPTSRAYRSRRPVVASAPSVTMPPSWEHGTEQEGIRSLLCLPLETADGVRYVVNIYCDHEICFDEQLILDAENLLNLAGLLIDTHADTLGHRADAEQQRRSVAALETRCRSHRQIMSELDAWHRRMLEGTSLAELISAISASTGASISVHDLHGHELAAAAAADSVDAQPLVREIVLGEGTVGTVTIACPHDLLSQPEVAGMLHLAPTLVGLRLQQEWAALNAESRLRGDLIHELLTSAPDSDGLIAHARVRWHVDLTQPLWLLAARVGSGATAAQPPTGVSRALLSAAERLVRRSRGALFVAEHDGHLVVLHLGDTAAEIQRFSENFRRELQAYAGAAVVSVAVGDRNDDLQRHKDSYRRAVALLDLVERSQTPGNAVTIEDLGLTRLLLGSTAPDELHAFAAQILDPLHEYDRQRNSGLVETLALYLGAGCNVSETAKRLHLHPNTVSYRLKRIAEILGLSNLADPRSLVRLELALSVDRLNHLAAAPV